MTLNRQTWRKRHSMGSSNGTAAQWVGIVSLLAALFASPIALAGWNAQPETIATHPTWIYTPNGTLKGSDKRGLMVALHGCNQTHDQIKNGGNLEKSADDFGLVMAVPFVTEGDGWHPLPKSPIYCWGYDKQLADEQGHVKELIDLANDLKSASRNLNIDPNHVYAVGLSSGGALALKLGCKAPDVFAGVGAIAGPSVGSNQSNAMAESNQIPKTNVNNAVQTCKSLAGGKSPSFATQIANIAYGDMDKNGPRQIIDYPPCQQRHPGQNCVASIRWSQDNIKILRNIYGTGELGNATGLFSFPCMRGALL